MGEDKEELISVSIHAPVRGATLEYLLNKAKKQFQSTPLCEGRHLYSALILLVYKFQSTPLCEGRLSFFLFTFYFIKFQSTPLCEGRRIYLLSIALTFFVSIHAPVRGATH